MLEFFSNIGGWLVTLGEFLVSLFERLFEVLVILGASLTLPLGFVGVLPFIISTSISVVLAIMVIKFILGR